MTTSAKRIFFPDLNVRLTTSSADDAVEFELRTTNVDLNEYDKPQDFGAVVIEAGVVVGDGSRDGFDIDKIKRLASLIEHAPDLFHILEIFTNGGDNRDSVALRKRAERVLADIRAGHLAYPADVV